MHEAPLNTRTRNPNTEQREAQTVPNPDKGRTHAQTPLVKNLTPCKGVNYLSQRQQLPDPRQTTPNQQTQVEATLPPLYT